MSRLVVLVFLPACVIAKVGDGEVATVTDSFTGITGFELDTFLDTTVTITPGVAEAVIRVTCDDSLLDELTADAYDGVLTLADTASYALVPRSDCHADLVVGSLTSISNRGSGLLEIVSPAAGLERVDASGAGGLLFGEVSGESLTIVHSGAGPVEGGPVALGTLDVTTDGAGGTLLTGTATDADVHVTGAGGFGEEGLVVQHLTLTLTGTGGAELTVTESIDATLTGAGGAVIHGNPPDRDVHTSGTGEVSFE